MQQKASRSGIVNKILIVFVALNIVGDVGNILLWWSSNSSQKSLWDGYLSQNVIGASNAFTVGAVVLAVVSIIYVASLVGLLKKMKWAPLLVIVISVVNRALGAVLYPINSSMVLWAVWTVILVTVAAIDWRKMNTKPVPQAASPNA
jgi:hypothetical protein